MSDTATKSKAARAPMRKPVVLSTVVEMVPVESLTPARVNDKVYKPIDLDDEALNADAERLRETIDRFGIGALDPLVLSSDGVIVSGHRRRGMLQIIGQPLAPVRRLNIYSSDPSFARVLTDYNGQRIKSIDELIREEVVRTSPEDAHNTLLAHRKAEAAKVFQRIEDSGLRILKADKAAKRSVVSDVKRPMLRAATEVIEKYRDFWPLTLRQIHYRLLGKGILRNTSLPETYKDKKGVTRSNLYVNDLASYKDLSDLLVRAKLTDEVPWESMHDPTRPRVAWVGWDNVGAYMAEQMRTFLCGYHRNTLQSQPAYVEFVVEKITAQEIGERAASRFHLPVNVGRGYTSVTTLYEMAQRFRRSGKDKFVLLIAGDFDPEGEDVCRAWEASLRDEHGITNITTVKIGVNPEQVEEYNLLPLPMKESSSRAAGFEAKHGKDVYELEAFEPDVLQRIIGNTIRKTLHMDLFSQEQRQESEEARQLTAVRTQFQSFLQGIKWDA